MTTEATQGPVVLVVDDTSETRRLMRRVLERDGVGVIEAPSGEVALEMIETARPDAVILDLRLPGISGQEVVRRIRAHPTRRIAATPVLACSASVQPEVRTDAIEAGCDAFEPKPFDVRAFPGRVRSLILEVAERRG